MSCTCSFRFFWEKWEMQIRRIKRKTNQSSLLLVAGWWRDTRSHSTFIFLNVTTSAGNNTPPPHERARWHNRFMEFSLCRLYIQLWGKLDWIKSPFAVLSRGIDHCWNKESLTLFILSSVCLCKRRICFLMAQTPLSRWSVVHENQSTVQTHNKCFSHC